MKSKIFLGSAHQGQHWVSLAASEKYQPCWSVSPPEEEQRLPHVAWYQAPPSASLLQTIKVGYSKYQLYFNKLNKKQRQPSSVHSSPSEVRGSRCVVKYGVNIKYELIPAFLLLLHQANWHNFKYRFLDVFFTPCITLSQQSPSNIYFLGFTVLHTSI